MPASESAGSPSASSQQPETPAAGWPFADGPEVEAITLGRILSGESALLLATHDEDDGAWQFLDGEHVCEEDAVVVCLGEMAQFDPTILALADLPRGWHAWRGQAGDAWQRAAGEPPVSRAEAGTEPQRNRDDEIS